MIRLCSTTKSILVLTTSSISLKQRHQRIATIAKMSHSNVLIYLMRRDLRVGDNPILHSLIDNKDHGFTHLLPLYVFAAQQIEVSGFITQDGSKSPYPEARSQIGAFWRCGPHRAKFLAESVWDLKGGLEKIGSGLAIRVGMVDEVVKDLIEGFEKTGGSKVSAVWMTSEEGVEEKREERSTKNLCDEAGVDFKLWRDEKYLIDDRDIPFEDPKDLPDVYTTYRKSVEPLREAPRPTLPKPEKNSLPPFPTDVPPQHAPFTIPTSYEEIESALLKPINAQPLIKNPPSYPENSLSVHPFTGGESHALERLDHLITSGSINAYKSSRNGLMGTDFSTKLSAYLALGSITSRQIHSSMSLFENGSDSDNRYKDLEGYGKGENEGTYGVRFELLWRDYMRLCTRKFGPKLFQLGGFKEEENAHSKWSRLDSPRDGVTKEQIQEIIERFLNGTTGMGFIDASQRECYHTGYTSNRARQNVASFLAKHLYIDWRIGAEWYESMLVDYDVSSNWGNWQYVAGVGNDPRGNDRIFNPVKQAFDYDPKAEYVLAWVDELRGVDELGQIFQAWTINDQEKKEELGIADTEMVTNPLKRIDFKINRGRGGGGGRGGGRGRPPYRPHGGDRWMGRRSGPGDQGRGGFQSGRGDRGFHQARRLYRGGRGSGSELRTGMMDKEREAAVNNE
ncbi:uncharacterized protein EAF02_002367 [Botrytis sinoallii]|uniref:uncharacterized protein n=1 Tax=Botrytis sinoallii TaxID=1463999 RepID=UPI0019021367|nr:uncharacterized protein EAF02_002367 [Botrytis sinoallii]KAF7889952.1 hypothetical protein EAF02_002367 [Botrytis sinoallii]